MNTISHIKSDSEASFILASLLEFFNLWKSGKKATFNLECNGKTASLNFSCALGHPDTPHMEKQKQKKRKKKSKSRAARDNARAARHQSGLEAVTSPEQPTVQSSTQSKAMMGDPPTPPAVPLESPTPTTPKRPATSPIESLTKRPAISSPSNGPLVQLPVWEASHSPEILRKNSDQDNSIIADLPPLTERHESDDEVEDGGEDDKDEAENEDEEDSSAVPCDCESRRGRGCQYREALRELGAADFLDVDEPLASTTWHWPPPTVIHRQRCDTM